MSMSAFDKRVFTWKLYVQSLREMFANMDQMREAARGGRVSRPFAEKIMLAVTQVNGCRYCDYGHTQAALQMGISQQELQDLKAGLFDDLPEEEVPALLFAQHYAESQGQPAPAAWDRLVETYGAAAAQDILAYIRMITIGNLYGNTFDALLSRFAGRPSADSTLLDEVAVLGSAGVVIAAPVGVLLWGLARLRPRRLPAKRRAG